jgi:hypothetical protein
MPYCARAPPRAAASELAQASRGERGGGGVTKKERARETRNATRRRDAAHADVRRAKAASGGETELRGAERGAEREGDGGRDASAAACVVVARAARRRRRLTCGALWPVRVARFPRARDGRGWAGARDLACLPRGSLLRLSLSPSTTHIPQPCVPPCRCSQGRCCARSSPRPRCSPRSPTRTPRSRSCSPLSLLPASAPRSGSAAGPQRGSTCRRARRSVGRSRGKSGRRRARQAAIGSSRAHSSSREGNTARRGDASCGEVSGLLHKARVCLGKAHGTERTAIRYRKRNGGQFVGGLAGEEQGIQRQRMAFGERGQDRREA